MDQNTKDLAWKNIQDALSQGWGLMLDWKFSAEDVVFNIRLVLPDLDLVSLGEKEIAGQWWESISIDGQTYQFLQGSADFIDQIFTVVNRHLQPTGKVFVRSGLGYDDLYFLLIDLSRLSEFQRLDFFPV